MLLSRVGSEYQKKMTVSNSEKSGPDRYRSSSREQFGIKSASAPATNTATASTASSLKSLLQGAPSGLLTRNTSSTRPSASVSGSGAVSSYKRNNDYYSQNNAGSHRSTSSSSGLLSSGNSLSARLGSSMLSVSKSLSGFSSGVNSSQTQNGISQYRLIGGQGSNSGSSSGNSSGLLQKSTSGLGGSFNLFG